MKKWILSILAVLAAAVLSLGGMIFYTFSGIQPLPDLAELSDGAVQIKDGMVSVGIVPSGPGQVILIDCGNDRDAQAVLTELKRRGLRKEAVQAAFITHGHADHVSGCSSFPNADIYALASEQTFLEGQTGSQAPIKFLIGKKNTGIHIKRYLNDGDAVQIGNQRVLAFATPGHTDGSAAYLVGKTVYFGDSADSGKDGSFHHAKWLFSNDIAQNKASLKRLADRLAPIGSQIEFLEFAHSGPLRGFGPLANFAKGESR